MKCSECNYYTGIQCHGHGDYWGNCQLIQFAYKEINRHIDNDSVLLCGYDDICFDDTDCIIAKLLNWRIKNLKKS